MKKSINFCTAILFSFISAPALSQTELLDLIETDATQPQIVESTFKGTRIINGHSIETRGGGELDVIFMHRFGTLNSGAYNLWGLDDAWIRLGAEYGITDVFTIGIGRSSYEKTYDGFLKYKLISQKKGKRAFPFTATAFTSMAINTLKPAAPEQEIKFSSRISYTYQLLLARKFNPDFSLQIAPTLVHHNLVDTPEENNDLLALGMSGRHKITRRMSLTFEYYLQFNNNTITENYDALGFGLEIETGGHVFHLVFSNTQAMIEKSFITETSGNFFDGDIHFGFNISRVFQLKPQKSGSKW